ncbi:MAG: GNAT family N-acetyltransferase [Candidatus Eisenbacteria bacterium]|nr:GNAT family N-acetyltransferase [Candidatus Eisenbacteria bacterium]
MNRKIIIRDEKDADAGAIHDVTAAAFENMEISNQTEPYIVEALRAAGALTVSLVAESDGRVVGHVAFSPVTVSDGTADWYGLGPVSVLPEYQRQGIGKALIEEGLSRLKSRNARGCCLVGDPKYYVRFGFQNAPEMVLEGVPPEVFQVLSFGGPVPQGTVVFHEGFLADGRQEGAEDPPRAVSERKKTRMDRGAIKRAYKEARQPMGVYEIRIEGEEKVFLDCTTDLRARFNRHRAELKFGSHRNKELQELWNGRGESAFRFSIIDELEHEEETASHVEEELETLAEMWMQKMRQRGDTVVRL